jgi:hypothetical protein
LILQCAHRWLPTGVYATSNRPPALPCARISRGTAHGRALMTRGKTERQRHWRSGTASSCAGIRWDSLEAFARHSRAGFRFTRDGIYSAILDGPRLWLALGSTSLEQGVRDACRSGGFEYGASGACLCYLRLTRRAHPLCSQPTHRIPHRSYS